jgi:hypothetical protein
MYLRRLNSFLVAIAAVGDNSNCLEIKFSIVKAGEKKKNVPRARDTSTSRAPALFPTLLVIVIVVVTIAVIPLTLLLLLLLSSFGGCHGFR